MKLSSFGFCSLTTNGRYIRFDTTVRMVVKTQRNAYKGKCSGYLTSAKIKMSTIVATIIDLTAIYVCFSKAVKIHSKDKTPVKKLSERINTTGSAKLILNAGNEKNTAHNNPKLNNVVTAWIMKNSCVFCDNFSGSSLTLTISLTAMLGIYILAITKK